MSVEVEGAGRRTAEDDTVEFAHGLGMCAPCRARRGDLGERGEEEGSSGRGVRTRAAWERPPRSSTRPSSLGPRLPFSPTNVLQLGLGTAP